MKHRFREYVDGDRLALGRLFDRADRLDGVARALSSAAADELPLYAFAPRYPLGLERGLTYAEVRSRLGSRQTEIERLVLVAADDATVDVTVDACVAVYPVGSDAYWMLDWVIDPARREAVAPHEILEAAFDRIGMLVNEAGRREVKVGGPARSNGAADSCSVEARAPQEDADVRLILNRAGMPAVRTFAILACDLGEAAPARESIKLVPEGIALRTYRSGNAPAWIAAFNASFSDHWGGFSYTEESWGRHASSPRFREDISVVAEAGEIIAGICHCAPSLNPNEKGLAHLHILGVHPAFRRRGLGYCLMVEAMGRLREHGFSRVELDMDSLNSRALPLYQQLGFREQEKITMYRRQIAVNRSLAT